MVDAVTSSRSHDASGPIDRGLDWSPHGQGSICGVPGVRVGHSTIVDGDARTGVTAIVPDPMPTPHHRLPCALFVGNGHGKLIGATQVGELGTLETPIVLTNTLSSFLAADTLVSWMLERPDCADVVTLNPVVAECNDSWLSDIRGRHVTAAHVREALDRASTDCAQGAVGAGTGMRALGFKGGIGTASRRTAAGHTLGVLALSNFSGVLRLEGLPIDPADDAEPQGNSCILVVATDAPVDARQLGRIARRAVFAMGTVGADYRHGSGDYGLAFSLTTQQPALADEELDPMFEAVIGAAHAALISSLWHAPTMIGHDGHTAYGLRETLRNRSFALSDDPRTNA
ncbi:P1 family peptidase [Yimella sp. cx-51]|nr:P1 family peptidase [Yimella sp. cx-51]MBC9956696.1 P1 family peptidase [Yimella sp. cx-51]QTH39521.1 P1 family peptidase [Yimella sp. cx-51]